MINVSTETDGECISEEPLRTGKQNFDESIKTALALSCVSADKHVKHFRLPLNNFLT